MDELIALIIVAACVQEQDRIAKQLAFERLEMQRWLKSENISYEEIRFARSQSTQVKDGLSILMDMYDSIIGSLMFEHSLPDWDDRDLVLVDGLRLSKNDPTATILMSTN